MGIDSYMDVLYGFRATRADMKALKLDPEEDSNLVGKVVISHEARVYLWGGNNAVTDLTKCMKKLTKKRKDDIDRKAQLCNKRADWHVLLSIS